MRGWTEIFHVNGNEKKTGVVILISYKIDFKIKIIIRDKEGDFPDSAVVKNLLADAGDTGSIPVPGRSHMPWRN